MFNGKKPINEPSDMSGLKIRVMKSPLMVNTVNAMGRRFSMARRTLSSKAGVLDGGENAAGNVLNDKFLKFQILQHPQHFRPPGVVVMSKKLGTH